MGRRLEGQPAVGLDIFRERNANLVEVSRSVLAEIDRIRGDSALRDVQVTVIQNLGKDVTSSLLELAEAGAIGLVRSEEHTSELQSLMRISYAVFCLTKNTKKQ